MELNQTSICYYDKKLAGISSCTETADSIVPDTFPDIDRIVCTYGTASIKDKTPQNGRLLVSGAVQTTVLYQSENSDELRRLSVPISFAHIEECEGLDADATCYVSCYVASIDVIPVNSRKISVSAQLCFETECYCKATALITEDIEAPHIQLLRTPYTVTLVQQVYQSPITILDDVSLQDAVDLQLINYICTLRSSECRAMRGKVVLKGDAILQCLALQDDGAIRTLSSTTPFTQILEMPELEEGDAVSVRLAAQDVDCRLDADGLLSYTISAEATFTVRSNQTIQQIDDLYIPRKSIKLQEEKTVLRSMPPQMPFTTEVNETLQTAHHVSHIIDSHAHCCSIKRVSDSAIQITAAVQILYLNEDQQLCALQRTVPLTASCNVLGNISQVELSARASSAGESDIILTVGVSGMAAVEECRTFRNITVLEECEQQGDLGDTTLVLRFIGEEQRLWEIAKHYGTTADAIRHANDLPDDLTNISQTMLLIPIQA